MGFIQDLRDRLPQKKKSLESIDTSNMGDVQKYGEIYGKLKDMRGTGEQPLNYEQIQKILGGRSDLDEWDVYILSIVYENHCDYVNTKGNDKKNYSYMDRYSMEKPTKTVEERKEDAMRNFPGVYIKNIKETIFNMINQGSDINQFSSTYINNKIFSDLIQRDINYEVAEQKRRDEARRKYEEAHPRWEDGGYGPSQASLDRENDTDGR